MLEILYQKEIVQDTNKPSYLQKDIKKVKVLDLSPYCQIWYAPSHVPELENTVQRCFRKIIKIIRYNYWNNFGPRFLQLL